MPAAKKTEDILEKPIELKGVKAKLQAVRVKLYESNLSKSGKNDFAHFTFFQLKDFLPTAQKLFAKVGLYSHFSIIPEAVAYEETKLDLETTLRKPIIKEIATLVIKDIESDEVEVYKMEVAQVMIGNNTKQNIYQAAGGRSTYYKRYLYRDALEIEEDDESDTVLGAPEVNYQAPVMNQPIMQPVQPVTMQQEIVNSVPVQPVQPIMTSPVDNIGQQATIVNNEVVTGDTLLTQQSKMEIMNIINGKNLNGYELLMEYCNSNGIGSPDLLKESDKVNILNYINSK